MGSGGFNFFQFSCDFNIGFNLFRLIPKTRDATFSSHLFLILILISTKKLAQLQFQFHRENSVNLVKILVFT